MAAACSDTPAKPPASTPPPAPSAAASTDPAAAVATAEILDRFRSFRQAYDAAGLTADYKSTALTQYLVDPLKQNVVRFLLETHVHGAAYKGETQSTPEVTTLDLKAKTATVTECYDTTKYLLFYTKSNSPVPVPSGSRRNVYETQAKDFGGKKGWLFTKSQIFKDRSC
ncbi:hypothetical protein [Actinoplanes sp. L3-i22]|uniref:hypothetical protein n=1 Tax=Actinoplanes sp. L3-i22 TaxID=2836373 RepID=UPI001C76022A|nr:hypothetical protein [Actinoplanes sp. L3-i22]BCY10931.1 hypothetical protein L3i22_060190 [Actinoplanes sp. L3-i22]